MYIYKNETDLPGDEVHCALEVNPFQQFFLTLNFKHIHLILLASLHSVIHVAPNKATSNDDEYQSKDYEGPDTYE